MGFSVCVAHRIGAKDDEGARVIVKWGLICTFVFSILVMIICVLISSKLPVLVHQGFDIKSIQEWMGHAEVETTLKIYAKVKEKEAKIEILNGMTQLIPAKPNNKGKE